MLVVTKLKKMNLFAILFEFTVYRSNRVNVVKPRQCAQNQILDQTYPVLRLKGPNVYQKKNFLRDQVYTFGEFEGPKTYFSLKKQYVLTQ